MEYRKLGNTDIDVSVICLGTMSYGEQNTEKEAHEQLDYSLDRGVNFIDTAEMYAIPPKKETYGKTEELIGTWIKKRGDRSKYIIATKVAGPGMEYVRGGSRLSSEHIVKAVESRVSLFCDMRGKSSCLTRSSVKDKQIKPLPCVAIKLIALSSTFDAGIIKSPSFSRFSSSTMITILPNFWSSIISSILDINPLFISYMLQ